MTEAWLAANATDNNIIMNWWSPTSLKQIFQGTNYEFVEVILPTPTQECTNHRIEYDAFCPGFGKFNNDNEEDIMTALNNDTADQFLYGDPRGACDVPPQLFQKFVLKGLYNLTHFDAASGTEIPEAIRSPAYEVLNSFTMTEAQLLDLFDYWNTYETPRDAVCHWVVDNLDTYMNTFIPSTYPRTLQESVIGPLMYFSLALGGLVALLVLVTASIVYKFRDSLVLKFAQLEFLFLLLVGALMLAAAAIVEASPPTNATCVANIWLVNVGYTLELVPLIVKVAALNSLYQAATRMRRVTLHRSRLFGTVAIISALVILFLALWTGFDWPQVAAEYQVTDTTTDYGETIVEKLNYCRSEYMFWYYVSVGWNVVLLFAATVLAVQTRSLKQAFNESQTLGILIYSHLVFVVLRIVTFFLPIQEGLLLQCRSIIYSVDTLATLIIYFLPKFLAKNEDLTDLLRLSRQGSSVQFMLRNSNNNNTAQIPLSILQQLFPTMTSQAASSTQLRSNAAEAPGSTQFNNPVSPAQRNIEGPSENKENEPQQDENMSGNNTENINITNPDVSATTPNGEAFEPTGIKADNVVSGDEK